MKKILTVVLAALMLAVGVNAAFEKVNTYNNNFSDVTEGKWFFENVKTAYELGFMNGKSDGLFDPNGNVTVVEGITMASRLHAIYNGTEVTKSEKGVEEYRFDFDDPEVLVDLSQRNSRNTHGINFSRATGKIEDSMLIVQSGLSASGKGYDPQIYFKGFELEANKYNKITFRMRRDALEHIGGPNVARTEYVEFFFMTNTAPGASAARQININFPKDQELTEWFEISADLGKHKEWKDLITGFRFDPTNDNGIYYIDYIVLSKSENIQNEKWYDMYIDYAVENGIIAKDTFLTDEYTRNITRAEICDLFAAAIPEEHFAPINDIKGIPDVLRDSKNADVYLTLYKAGILLGADAAGNFKPDADIKRSEIAAIINRVALPENRVKGTIDYDWAAQGNEYDVEFNDEKSLEEVTIGKAESAEIVNGALVLKPKFMGENAQPKYDPQVGVSDILIAAEDYTKLKVRMKVEFIGETIDKKFDFYFQTDDGTGLSERKSMHKDFTTQSYLDPFGWYVMEVDFTTHKEWKGNITGFRFDPANTNGIYAIDYIRLVSNDPMFNASHEELLAHGYTSHGMLQDNGFERGFFVTHYEQKDVSKEDRNWQYTDTQEKPTWDLGPWWNGIDLWENRDLTTDKYTLTDTKGVNTLVYNPEEKSLSMRVNATKIYNGEPHDVNTYKWWPHLLLNQQYTKYPVVDKAKNSAAADRIFVELDMRILDFKNTTNPEGANSCQFPLYFYFITDKAPNEKIWFGLSLMNGLSANGSTTPGWSPDSAAHQYMYSIPQATVHGGMENSFNPEKGVMVTGEEWKHIRVDITPHIERCIEWANRDKAYGVEVTKEDMYFGGCNIGFEIHGNYDCTVEIKNLDMIAYNKAE